MGLTKQYLRYTPCGTFNIIVSPKCNGVWVIINEQEGRYVAVGACEDIIIWDLQLAEKALVLPGEKTEVTFLCPSPLQNFLGAGYKDGTVKTFDLRTGENLAIFSGHKSEITSLAYDNDGHRLASGSKDTHIIIWDIVSETGIARFVGHTGPVTCVVFMSEYNILISSSKDTSVRFWDLDTNFCFKTLLGHRTEVWGLVLMKNDDYLVTGCGDSELRVWNLIYKPTNFANENVDPQFYEGDNKEEDSSLSLIKCIKTGSILRSGTGRVVSISSNSTGQILSVHGASDSLELFSFASHLESLQRLKKRKRKEKKKAEEGENQSAVSGGSDSVPGLQDIVRRLPVIKTKGKIKSSSMVLGKIGELRVVVTLNNNTIELHSFLIDKKVEPPVCRRRINLQGHHSEVRCLAFSSDNLAIVSGSADTIKIWNRPTLTCLRTITAGYVLSICFVPGDRHVIAGLKDGRLLIIDISAGDVLEEIQGHEKEVWSVCLLPNQRGCVSGSSDTTVRFWDFELIDDKDSTIKAKVLSLLHKRTLKVDESILCVQISPNSKLISVSLLDMTVKIFFMDTLKFFLSLYGHKLPVLCMDISSDSTLIATGSADRNIKIWGLDFGDCHKSIFAHDDSITSLRFLPNTHYFFSCGKDGKVKQWDADNFQKIITLEGHFGEAWHISVSPNGVFVATSGADRVLRMYTKTDEPLILEDEEEEEREKEENNQLVTGEETTVKGKGNLNLPSRKTVGSEQGAEQILECLDICKKYSLELEEYKLLKKSGRKNLTKPLPPPLMSAYNVQTPEDFILVILRKIRASDLEESLLLLPFPSVHDLLEMFPPLLSRGHEVELIVKTLLFLLKIHNGPIVSNQNLLPLLKKISGLAFQRVNELRDLIGYNLHGLQFLQRDIEHRQGIQLFRDATLERKNRVKKNKRKERALKRAIMTL